MRTRSLATLSLVSLTLSAAPLNAQSLAARVSAVGNGAVTFHFTPRRGVCGDGESFIRTGGSSYHGSFTVGRPMEPCLAGPVQVRLTLLGGSAQNLQAYVGPVRGRNARDLGAVPAEEAARYLMSLATEGSSGASAKAIFPAVLADSATVWPALLAIAKDPDSRSRATRRDALFWLSRYARAAAAGRRNDPFMDDEEDEREHDGLKSHAVFVLSQLPRGEGVPALLEVARSNHDSRVRGQAMFWLGQSGDPRAIALFESVLRR